MSKKNTKPAQPETDPGADETKAAAAETEAAAGETSETAQTESSASTAMQSRVGRRARVKRDGAICGELGIVAEEKDGGALHVKLSGPMFVNDPGVTLTPDEYELLD